MQHPRPDKGASTLILAHTEGRGLTYWAPHACIMQATTALTAAEASQAAASQGVEAAGQQLQAQQAAAEEAGWQLQAMQAAALEREAALAAARARALESQVGERGVCREPPGNGGEEVWTC